MTIVPSAPFVRGGRNTKATCGTRSFALPPRQVIGAQTTLASSPGRPALSHPTLTRCCCRNNPIRAFDNENRLRGVLGRRFWEPAWLACCLRAGGKWPSEANVDPTRSNTMLPPLRLSLPTIPTLAHPLQHSHLKQLCGMRPTWVLSGCQSGSEAAHKVVQLGAPRRLG